MWKLGALYLLAASFLFGQASGRISGSVSDASGAPVPGALVEILVPSGATAIYTTRTNDAGLFSFAAIRPETYDLLVTAAGFAKLSSRRVVVESLRDTSLTLKLEVASVSESVEVQADAQSVQLTTAELANTVTRQQIELLPTPNRQISSLFTTQAGVSNGRGPTAINGLRTSAANVTLDGVNIQDNYIRTNSLDFMPFRPTIDQISEITIAVGNAASTIGGGASQIAIVTRSGSNEYHGSAYWYNQNSFFGANEFFNNRSAVARPFLNLNQPGAALGGKVIRDRLFFFGNWEDYRLKQQASQLRTVLTPEARQGLFRYSRGAQNANLLQLRNIGIDPAIASTLQELPLPNSTDAGDGFNTSGYRFNARSNSTRRQYVTRWDFYLTSKHNFTGTYNNTYEKNDRPDVTTRFYNPISPNFTETQRHLTSGAWRWTVTPALTNELRGGVALSPTKFVRGEDLPARFITGTIFTNPVNDFTNEGRNTNTYSIQDNANWVRGRHELSFGFQSQFIRTDPLVDAGIVPSYAIGISAANTTGFTAAQLPGISTGDLATANSLYASLAGYLTTGVQTFNVTSPDSGFVRGATNQRRLAYDTLAGYLQDRWKVSRRLTLTLGLRYEYWTRLRERNNLFLLPAIKNGNIAETLLDPLAIFDFVGRGGRQFYNADRNNFAPNIGVAYDLFGNGKTALRGGYSISYFNDEAITALRNSGNTNDGLAQDATLTGLVARASGAPAIPVPVFKVPRTQADNYALNTSAALGVPDPNLRTPYAHQFSFGVQHDYKGTIFEIRYAGNHATQLLRGVDYNQVVIRQNGFLEDFIRARNNAFVSERAGLGFNPAYTGPGSQPLTVFPRLASGGLLTNATIQARIRSGEAGELANLYQTNGLRGTVDFYRNPNALGANGMLNSGISTYHSLQFDVRRRLSRNLQFQANYTFGKVLSDTAGDSQNRFEPFLDFGNNSLERARAPFDLTHAIKGNWSYALPVGKGQRWSAGKMLDYAVGGWVVNGLMEWQSGFPFSVMSQRGTLNRVARSTARNTATALLTKSELDALFNLEKSGSGVFFLSPGARNPADGRGVANDGQSFFNGQAFVNPGPGDAGALQRRMFSGPWNFALNMGLVKRFAITERQTLELRGEAFNLTNTPGFLLAEVQDVNSANFGRITGVNISGRTMQFALYYRF